MKRRRQLNPFQGGVPPELVDALSKFSQVLAGRETPFALIGGLALAFHFPQFPTDDVDLAVAAETDIPEQVPGFKRVSPHVFEDQGSGVIVDLVTSRHIGVPAAVQHHAMATAISHVDPTRGVVIPVAQPLAIFAIKLSRGRIKDQAHLMWMMRYGFRPREEDLVAIGVAAEKLELYAKLRIELAREEQEEEQLGW